MQNLPAATPDSEAHATRSPAHEAALSRLLEDLRQHAAEMDFYVVLRHLDAALPGERPLGRAWRLQEEPIRLSQYPSQIFPPGALKDFTPSSEKERHQGRLSVYHFGLFGPHGPLPGHITEYVQERLIHHRDVTMLRFLDMFQHRMLLLFYRAWADCQSTVSLDRPERDAFTRYVASLVGLGQPSLRNRDSVPDYWKCGLAGHFVRMNRNAEGLVSSLAAILRVPVALESFVRQWLTLDPADMTALGGVRIAGRGRTERVESGKRSAQLGLGAVAGRKVPDIQHRFRLRLGPLTRDEFESFLPGALGFHHLRDVVRNYLGLELDWDVRLVLKKEQVPSARLGDSVRLGWTSWLAMPIERRRRDADDVLLQYERSLA